MTQSLACLGVLAAVLAAAFRWDLPSRPGSPAAAAFTAARLDQAIQGGVRVKPKVRRNKIKIQRIPSDQDNSNTSYAALGLRACHLPQAAPSWMHRAGGRLERAGRAMLTLKDLARKSILSRVF